LSETRNVAYPIDIEGNPLKEGTEDFWDTRYGYTKFHKAICENDLDIPEDFDYERMKYHFYGRKIADQMILDFMEEESTTGCQCERCRGWRFYVAENGNVVEYEGWRKPHYQMIHAAHMGAMPTDMDMIMDCNCKACKSFRNTVNNKESLQYTVYSDTFRDKLYDPNARKYLTADYLTDFCIKPEEIKPYDEALVTDFHWRAKARHFKNMFETERSRHFPIKFDAIQLRYRYAYIHCRLNNVEWKDVQVKANEWLLEVFSTLMKPKCNCYVCKSLKDKSGFSMDIWQELFLDRVDNRSYPTAIVGIHFNSGGWHERNTPYTKQEVFDYFEKYVLYGKFCECEKCKKFQERIASAEFLPPEELEAPKCPICGGRVHNKDLIYNNKEIAKAIIKQGFDRLIKVKTALCCGCYGKFAAQGRRRELLFELKKGENVKIGGKNARVRAKLYLKVGDNWVEWNEKEDGKLEEDDPFKEDLYIVIKHGEGELQTEEWITMSEFAGMQYDFKLPGRLEKTIHARN